MDRFTMAMWGRSPAFVPLPDGSEGELLCIGGGAGQAQLHLVCGGVNETVARVQAGDFSVSFVRRPGTALTMLTCEVGDHQWLLARDSPVLRVGARKFAFAFPGFFYALALPDGCFDAEVRRLEVILAMTCSYRNHAGERDSDFCVQKPETNFWASAYTKIQRLSVKPPPQPFPRGPTGPHASTQWTWEQATVKLQRALRASAATKLLAKILNGAVDAAHHIEVVGPVGASATSRGGCPYVFPSLRAVLDIVDAVEAARGIGTGSWSMSPDCWVAPPDGAVYWHFNVAGLMLILRAFSAVAGRNRTNQGVATRGVTVGGGSSSTPHSVVQTRGRDVSRR